MDAEKLIDRIRKLLAVAADTPYEAEAQTALGVAQKLMLEHGLSMDQVETTDTDRKWTRERVWNGERRSSADDHALVICQEFFFVRPLVGMMRLGAKRVSRPQFIDFVGSPEHVAIARYVYTFLCRTFQRLWKLRVKNRHRRRAWDWLPRENPADYYLGLRLGFAGKLRSERQAAESRHGASAMNGLIRVGSALTRLDAALDREAERQSSGRTYDVSRGREPEFGTVVAGMGDGSKINMRTPLSAPATQKPLIGREA